MKKIKTLLESINYTALCFGGYLAKCLIMSQATTSDALIMLGLSALYGYNQLLKLRTQPPINQAVIKEIENLKGAMSAIKLDRGMKRDNDAQIKRMF